MRVAPFYCSQWQVGAEFNSFFGIHLSCPGSLEEAATFQLAAPEANSLFASDCWWETHPLITQLGISLTSFGEIRLALSLLHHNIIWLKLFNLFTCMFVHGTGTLRLNLSSFGVRTVQQFIKQCKLSQKPNISKFYWEHVRNTYWFLWVSK